MYINPIALRKAKIVYNFGLSECNRVNKAIQMLIMTCFVGFFFHMQVSGPYSTDMEASNLFAYATTDKRPVYM